MATVDIIEKKRQKIIILEKQRKKAVKRANELKNKIRKLESTVSEGDWINRGA